MPLETIGESESPLKERSRTCLRRTPSLSVVPLVILTLTCVSYGMEPEQEALSIVSFKD